MVIQSTAEAGQVSIQLLTTVTALLIAAATLLISKEKAVDAPMTNGAEE
jgi:hypothetical protein